LALSLCFTTHRNEEDAAIITAAAAGPYRGMVANPTAFPTSNVIEVVFPTAIVVVINWAVHARISSKTKFKGEGWFRIRMLPNNTSPMPILLIAST
jgi:hypothetical protein